MLKNITRIQKCALGFAAMFLGVYLLDYVPGIMAPNGKMFGLFGMTRIVDLGHLVLGTLAALAAWHSPKLSRIYFYVLGVWYAIDVITFFGSHLKALSLTVNILVNLPHFLISIAAFWIAAKVDRRATGSSRLNAT